MKKLKSLKYHTFGGFCDEKDLHKTSLEFTISDCEVYCNLFLLVGDIVINKIFKSKEHSVLNNVIDLLNNCDFAKLDTDYDRMMLNDISDNVIEYSYDDYNQLTKVKNPNNKGLLKLLNDFMMNYLLKDSELIAIFNAIINNNLNNDYLSLKYIIKNKNIFDINKEYNLNQLTENKVDITIRNNKDNPKHNVSIDELINEINNRIENIDKS